MIRRAVISSDKIAYNPIIPGRLVHLRLMFHCIHDIFSVYQFAWNTTRDQTDLTRARAELWTRLGESVRHIPRRHMLLVAGDFNTPLDQAAPFVCASDAKFSRALQRDKNAFQGLITDLRLVAIHCKQCYRHTFIHGSRATRIDFMFMREHQIRWQKLKAHVHCHFERTLGVLGPIHRPLTASLPRWLHIKQPPVAHSPIDRFRLRQEFLSQTTRWQAFENAVQALIRMQTLRTPDPNTALESQSLSLETAIRQLCIRHFPRPSSNDRPHSSALVSMTWNARRSFSKATPRTLHAMFQCLAPCVHLLGFAPSNSLSQPTE